MEINNITQKNLPLSSNTKNTVEANNLSEESISTINKKEISDNFLVKNSKENLFLFLKEALSNDEKNILVKILKDFNLKPTKENLDLVKVLVRENFPVTKENILNLNKGLKLAGENRTSEITFLLKNEIEINQKNIDVLDSFLSGENILSENLSNLVEHLESIKNPSLKELLHFSLKENIKPLTSEKNQMLSNLIEKNLSTMDLQKEIVNLIVNEKLTLEDLNNFYVDNLNNSTNIEAKDKLTLVLKEFENIEKAITEFKENNFSGNKELTLLENDFLGNKSSDIKSFDIKSFDIKNLKLNKEVLDFLKESLNNKQTFDNLEDITFDFLKKSIDFSSDKKLNPKDIDDLYNNIKENIEIIKNTYKNFDTIESSKNKISESAMKLNDSLDFFVNTKNEMFFQIPFHLEGKNNDAEIFIFKDKRVKRKSDNSSSALISLNTLSFDKFETLIQKKENNVSLQFRIKNKEVESIVKKEISNLVSELKNLNYNLTNVSYQILDKNFNVLSKELPENFEGKQNVNEIVSFDKRA